AVSGARAVRARDVQKHHARACVAAARGLRAQLVGGDRQVGRHLPRRLGAADGRGDDGRLHFAPFLCLAAGVTQVPEARQTTTGSVSRSAAESDTSGRGEMYLRASNFTRRLVFPTETSSASTSTKSPACSGARNSTES